jgi:hypothetical protein
LSPSPLPLSRKRARGMMQHAPFTGVPVAAEQIEGKTEVGSFSIHFNSFTNTIYIAVD